MAISPLSTPLTSALARLQLRHLHCFLAVARLGSLRRAAETLSITQPAVTKTVAELEDILGVRLFHRGRRGAVLTPEAFTSAPEAEQSWRLSVTRERVSWQRDSVLHEQGFEFTADWG